MHLEVLVEDHSTEEALEPLGVSWTEKWLE